MRSGAEAEIEAMILGIDPTTTADGDEFDLSNAIPMDIVSPFKHSYKDRGAKVRDMAAAVHTTDTAVIYIGE